MIDIHSHILFEIDDGSKTMEESISILKKMREIGFQKVVATPHYISGTSYTTDNFSKSYRLGQLKFALKKENILIDLYLGNEIFIDSNIQDLIKSSKIATIHGSKYILVEFPRNTQVLDLSEILFKLRNKGYIPIIAHPERYLFLQEDYRIINEFLEMGCLFQGNFENVIEKYGKESEKLFWYMLKNKKYQFLATDVHHDTDKLFYHFSKIQAAIIKEIGKEEYKLLTYDYPMKVLENEIISIGEIIPVVKKFGKWK